MAALRAMAAAALALALLPATGQAEVPPDADWHEEYIATPGQPRLHADVLVPKGTPAGARLPVVLSIGPYFPHAGEGGPKEPLNQGPHLRWRDLIEQGRLFAHGYALVQVDLRGYGGSDGCNDLGGRGEQADVARAVEWAAAQPWSNGRVAVYGKSYDAWTAVMALDSKPRGLAAVVPMSPVADGYRTVYQNGVHYDLEWYGIGAIYNAYEATPPTPFDAPEYILAGATSTDPVCWANNAVQGQVDADPNSPYWAERALPRARGAEIPVLWSHGFMDKQTKPDNILPVWSTLRGPKRAWFGQFAHDRPNDADLVGHDGWFDELFRFLDRYVKDDPAARPDGDPAVEVADGRGRWRAEAQWPPADAVPYALTLRAGSYTDLPGNTAAGGPVTGAGTWSFSPALPHDAWLAGAPSIAVRASTTASATLIALLYDVAPDGTATLITRGAAALPGARESAFDLYPQDWPLAAGHRIGVLLTGSDQDWYLPAPSGARVDVAGGRLELPFLSYRRDRLQPARETPAMAARKPIAIAPATLAAATTTADLPPALAARPAGSVQGRARPPLRVALKRAGARLRVTVRGALGTRVRITLARAGRAVARRTVAVRGGVARAVFRVTRTGVYRARATAGGRAGRSAAVRVRRPPGARAAAAPARP